MKASQISSGQVSDAGSTTPVQAVHVVAGVARITVHAVPLVAARFEVLVAYPTDVAEAPFESGPFTIHASLNAPIAPSKAFPVLLFSHGDGRGGSPLPLRDLIASLAIYDTMQYVKCDVATVCVGKAASMGAVLLTA